MKKHRVIRRLLDAVVICFIIFTFSSIFAGDNITSTEGVIMFTPPGPTWTLSITKDGQFEINGKAIERMNNPEIKAIMRELADAMKKQAENDSLVRYYDRQTGYLLQELEKCLKSR